MSAEENAGQETPLDLPALREYAERRRRGGYVNGAFELDSVLALLDLAEAGNPWTTVYPCKTSHEQPYDFKQCETHDRTFPLDGTCDHAGKNEIDWLSDR